MKVLKPLLSCATHERHIAAQPGDLTRLKSTLRLWVQPPCGRPHLDPNLPLLDGQALKLFLDLKIDQVVRVDVFFGDGTFSNGVSTGVDGLRVAGDQRVPVGQILSLSHPTVSAAPGKPSQPEDIIGFELETVGHQHVAQIVVASATGLGVEQETRNPGVAYLPGGGVLKFLQAAAPAAVT